MYSIYCITLPNGKKYVGQSATIQRRFHQHRTSVRKGDRNNAKNFYDDWRKFGIETAVFEILEEKIATKEKALEREYNWVAKLNTVENGYNIAKSKTDKSIKKQKYKCKVFFPNGKEFVYDNFNVAGKSLKTDSQIFRKIADRNEPYMPLHMKNAHLRGIIVERIVV